MGKSPFKIDPKTPREVNLNDPAVLDELEERILVGELMSSICSDPEMPSLRDFYKLLAIGDEISARLHRARQAAQDAEIDKTVEIADKATNNNWKVAKLKIQVRHWRAGKLSPIKYGDLAIVNAKQQGDNVTRVLILNDPESKDSTNTFPEATLSSESDL